MEHIAEVVSIDELRRRRSARETPRAAMCPPPLAFWTPVWVAWVPVWQAPAAARTPAPSLRNAAWGSR